MGDDEEELAEILIQKKALEEREKVLKEKLIAKCDGRATQGTRLRFTPYERQGTVDYSKIEALKGIDLDKYRKPPITAWRIDLL